MIINTQEDLSAIIDTPEYHQFLAGLRGSLFTVRKDEVTQKWVADENNETIERFGLTRADFDPIALPELPVYKEDHSEALQELAELKQKLSDTDYVTLSDYDKSKPEILAQRKEWRDQIRVLEESMGDTQ